MLLPCGGVYTPGNRYLKMENPIHVITISCALACACMPAAAQMSPEILLLSQIKDHTKKDLAAAGNSTCVETVARSSRKTAGVPMQSIDTLRFEVARIGGKELFSFPGERRFTQRPLTELVGMGMTVEGLFGSFVHELISNNVPTILPAGDSTSSGRRIVQYDFRFPVMMSHYILANAAGSASVGWSGSFWADVESLELVRLRVQADDIPLELGIRSAVTEIEYGPYQLDTATLQLPQTSTVTMTYWNGAMSVNRTDFSQCRAFSAASNVAFDEATPGDASVLADVPTLTLPEGLTIRLHLDQPVEFGQAVVGDPVSATIEVDVRERGKIWLTKGTTISGRVRRLEKQESPSGAVAIDLEFSETSQQGNRLRFTGTLVASDFAAAKISRDVPTSYSSRGRSLAASTTVNEFAHSDVPGVATLLVRAKPYRIPGGFKMVWKTYRSKAEREK
jgi:hypothetical protein